VTRWPVNKTSNSRGACLNPGAFQPDARWRKDLKRDHFTLGFLVDVGLDYLTLSRPAGSLSGGEAQRIRLATQIGSRLMGVLYVLDEPSIGLHPRDNDRLLETLKRLRDMGNTVLVVEHDEETIRAADWVLDLGPGAGLHGGEVVAEGTVEDILANKKSLTGAYLSGRKMVPLPKKLHPRNGKALKIVGARANNLKNLTVEIPLGQFVCITGVSGSGKSTLMVDILYNVLARELNRARTHAGDYERIEGLSTSTRSSTLTRAPSAGRRGPTRPLTQGCSTRSAACLPACPKARCAATKPEGFRSTYTGTLRSLPGSRSIAYRNAIFAGYLRPCDVCHGARFNRETLQVKFKGFPSPTCWI
jgi:excinuclease ABC subunit A